MSENTPWRVDRGINPDTWAVRSSDGELLLCCHTKERAERFAAMPELLAFHDAWIESEVANATGGPDLANEKRKALIARHQAVTAALATSQESSDDPR